MERHIFLLQLLLATELLIRLDFAGQPGRCATTTSNNTPLHWNLELARTFLDNLEITLLSDDRIGISPQAVPELFYQPKHIGSQISKLFQFAEAHQWPNMEQLKKNVISQAMDLLRADSTRSKVAAVTDIEVGVHKLPYHVRLHNRFSSSKEANTPAECGWLTRSWLSGLAMTDEAVSALLMAILLESSPNALAVLGVEANLKGGFIYGDRAYWSVCSDLGGSLETVGDVVEWMGWASSLSADESGWVGDSSFVVNLA